MTALPYELAKKLKDAGWPQPAYDAPVKGDWVFDPMMYPTGGVSYSIAGSYSAVYSPTLSELIAACPRAWWYQDDDYPLTLRAAQGAKDHVASTGWVAEYGFDLGPSPLGTGETPEEALANLWLKLKEEGKI